MNRTGKIAQINLYDAVRYSWKIAPKRAERADYVLAVIDGEIVGAFESTNGFLPRERTFLSLHPPTDLGEYGKAAGPSGGAKLQLM